MREGTEQRYAVGAVRKFYVEFTLEIRNFIRRITHTSLNGAHNSGPNPNPNRRKDTPSKLTSVPT